MALDAIQEGERGIFVLRVVPGARSMVDCGAGDAVRVLGSTNSNFWKSGPLSDKSPKDCLGMRSSEAGCVIWGNDRGSEAKVGGDGGMGFLKSGRRRDDRRIRLTPVLKRFSENMLSRLVVGVADCVLSIAIGGEV